jgi:hypothetical protein
MSLPRTRRFVAFSTAAVTLLGLQGLTSLAPAAGSTSAGTYSAQRVSTMRFGYSTPATGGMSTAEAVQHQINTYGPGVVRRYYNRFPAGWGTINKQTRGLPLVVSFKMKPQAVNRGTYDKALTAWFKAAPRDRKTWWSYMPEPEDDIKHGQYSAAQFRSAYARVAKISRRASNPRLVSTLMLMAYTAGSCGRGSKRNVYDYWPGSSNVDMIGYDCSNRGVKVGKYPAASTMLAGARATARRLGKPWGLAEIESQRLKGDDGSRRAAWLRDVVRYLTANGGTFACYFDENRAVDFRLTDPKSRAAWRSIVTNQHA